MKFKLNFLIFLFTIQWKWEKFSPSEFSFIFLFSVFNIWNFYSGSFPTLLVNCFQVVLSTECKKFVNCSLMWKKCMENYENWTNFLFSFHENINITWERRERNGLLRWMSFGYVNTVENFLVYYHDFLKILIRNPGFRISIEFSWISV